MRTVSRLIVVLALAAAVAGCVSPTSTSPAESSPGGAASELPTFPFPGSTGKPGQPNPTIEVPPPID
jgi:hypothetical protein